MYLIRAQRGGVNRTPCVPRGRKAEEEGAASPAARNPIPLPRASLSFSVKQPGGLGYKLHSKCSKISLL